MDPEPSTSTGITITRNRYEDLQDEGEKEGEEVEYTFGNGLPMERAIKKCSRVEERANRELIEKLKKKEKTIF